VRALDRTLASVPSASGAMVMATGIVSLALSRDGRPTLAHILLAVAALQWIALGVVLGLRFARRQTSVARPVRSPGALTAVAGTAVLGTGLTGIGWVWPGIVLLASSLALWVALIGQTLAGYRPPATGISLMVTVATESLAVLSAAIATHEHARWLVPASLVPLVFGLVLYCWVIAGFDFAELTRGSGDQWVAGGALAISAFATGRIALAAHDLDALGDVPGPLRSAAIALWVLAILWLAPLLVGEALRPRPRYHPARWSTVFPLGMYAACSFDVGTLAPAPAVLTFARVWTWIALAAWTAVSAGILRRGLALCARRDRGRPHAGPGERPIGSSAWPTPPPG
jgi:tellurite resistance protein TehA-like permease